jgi:RNA polymerase sigma-70 factor (ECF subfamily)
MPEKPVIDSRNSDILENEDILVRHSQEDPAAFGPIFDYYAPRVYRYALHRIGNVRDAEDVTSRTFTDALQGLGRYRTKRHGSFGGWLFTIARRRCVDHFRVSNPFPLASFNLIDKAAGPLAVAITREEQSRLEEILKSLKENEQELLRLRFAAELTYRQIGEILGKTEGAAKMSLVRLIKKMRDLWERDDG